MAVTGASDGVEPALAKGFGGDAARLRGVYRSPPIDGESFPQWCTHSYPRGGEAFARCSFYPRCDEDLAQAWRADLAGFAVPAAKCR
jgi:hypothetical protein